MNFRKYFLPTSLILTFVIFVFWSGCGENFDYNPQTQPGSDITSPTMIINNMDTKTIDLSINPLRPSLLEKERQGIIFTEITFPKQVFFGEVGAPAIPYLGINFAIPFKAEVEVEVDFGEWIKIGTVTLMPVQPAAQDKVGVADPEFVYLPQKYSTDILLPENPEILENEKILRGVRVNQFWISPVRYNPSTGELFYADRIDIRVKFIGGKDEFYADPLLRSPAYEKMLRKFSINHSTFEANMEKESQSYKSATGDPVFYIITHPQFLEEANKLAIWKLRLGILAKVFSTDQIGATAKEIRQFISEAYFKNDPPLEYVLFIGDAEYVPTLYGSFHSSHFSLIGSDHYYACVDGDDNFADIGVGRISVDSYEQSADRIDKIINYEQGLVEDESFYNTSYQFAYFQDSDKNNKADRRFLLTSEEIYRWFSDVLEDGHITSNRCYVTDEDVLPQKWSTSSSYHFFADWWKWGTDKLPNELLRGYGFDWSCDREDISKAINAGANFVTHRDHGFSEGWGDPAFYSSDVMGLVNGDKTPVVWTVNCETGWFDNETDSIINFSSKNRQAFVEAWQRNLKGGAVGLIAATRISYSGFNDRLVWGWMDAIWPGYIPGYPRESEDDFEGLPAGSDVVNYGKFYMSTVYGPSSTRNIATEEFQWFGDPTMKMWTRAPLDIEVQHVKVLSYYKDALEIKTDVEDALIVLVINNEIVAMEKSTGSTQSIPISIPLNDGMVVSVTISKDNHRPYRRNISVAQCGLDAECSDGVFCNGVEECFQNNCYEGDPPLCDDGVFCNGTESCDIDLQQCVSSGDPCPLGETCDEVADACKADSDSDNNEGTCGF